MHLWVEATRTTVYVQNYTPHRLLENKAPEEVFSAKKQEVNHLKIFGCPVYIHIPKEKRTKLDPSGKKGIFVGYFESSKAHRIYFPRFKNIKNLKNLKKLYIHLRRKILTRGNLLGYKNLSKVQKDMGL